MDQIKGLNQQIKLDNEEIESMVLELAERGEFACTGQACVAQAEGI